MIPANKAEIMAPAGSYESLAAAIQAGADSVYF
jgi:putative protease